VKKPAEWDLDNLLLYDVYEWMRLNYGVLPSKKKYVEILQDIKSRSGLVTKRGLVNDDRLLSNWDNTVQWFVRKLCFTPDGIASIARKSGPNPRSALYTEVYEVMRTHRKKSFTAEQIAERIHMDLSRDRRNQLRQLRRLLIKVCEENSGRVRRPKATQTTFEIR